MQHGSLLPVRKSQLFRSFRVLQSLTVVVQFELMDLAQINQSPYLRTATQPSVRPIFHTGPHRDCRIARRKAKAERPWNDNAALRADITPFET